MGQQKAPGKSYRQGISLIELAEMFPDESSARQWFEERRWPDGVRPCPDCKSLATYHVVSEKPLPYRCRACKVYFSVRSGTVLERSKISLKKWIWAIYLCITNLKGVSSMKLHRDLRVTQKTAWFMAHRLREAWTDNTGLFRGPIEVDEAYIGGKEGNKHGHKKLHSGPHAGKAAILGIKDRETNAVSAVAVRRVDGETLRGYISFKTELGVDVFTDEYRGYRGVPNHKTVNHSVGQYVDGMAHTNGIESFWSMLKRGYHGTYHKMSPKHLGRYVNEFAGRHNFRRKDTAAQMTAVATGLVGRRLMYRDLIARGPERHADGSDVF